MNKVIVAAEGNVASKLPKSITITLKSEYLAPISIQLKSEVGDHYSLQNLISTSPSGGVKVNINQEIAQILLEKINSKDSYILDWNNSKNCIKVDTWIVLIDDTKKVFCKNKIADSKLGDFVRAANLILRPQ
jgi:hypothetical protein